MKMLRFAAVMMFATAATFACSDDDSTPNTPVAGNAGEGGDDTSGGGTTGGGGKGGAGTGGNAGGAQGGEGATGGELAQAGSAQGGAAGEGGAALGGAAQGGAAQGGEGGETLGGAAGAGGEAPACVNQFDSGEGGSGGEGGDVGSALEIAGDYDDNFAGTHVITSKLWNSSGVIEYDNEANVVYLQNPCDADFSPNLFNKIVYTEPENGTFYFCWVDFGLATLEAAKASTKVADASDPATKGCGSFSWSKATAQ